jgi:hypothetical protein
VVTHRSTNLPVHSLCMPERTGWPVFCDLWSYVEALQHRMLDYMAITSSQSIIQHIKFSLPGITYPRPKGLRWSGNLACVEYLTLRKLPDYGHGDQTLKQDRWYYTSRRAGSQAQSIITTPESRYRNVR